MTLEQRISAQIQAWRDCGQGAHADALRQKMWELLGPFYRGRG